MWPSRVYERLDVLHLLLPSEQKLHKALRRVLLLIYNFYQMYFLYKIKAPEKKNSVSFKDLLQSYFEFFFKKRSFNYDCFARIKKNKRVFFLGHSFYRVAVFHYKNHL